MESRIHNLEREHKEQELRHKTKQVAQENKQRILNSGISIVTQQISFNSTVMFRGLY